MPIIDCRIQDAVPIKIQVVSVPLKNGNMRITVGAEYALMDGMEVVGTTRREGLWGESVTRAAGNLIEVMQREIETHLSATQRKDHEVIPGVQLS
jgi:hypothetical protein